MILKKNNVFSVGLYMENIILKSAILIDDFKIVFNLKSCVPPPLHVNGSCIYRYWFIDIMCNCSILCIIWHACTHIANVTIINKITGIY